jgi:topoisomerase-4 subunit B
VREFCEFRNLLPRGIKITPDDVWEKVSFVLSVKLNDPQFSGQTKERLSSRECAPFVSGVTKDAFSLWLNQHVDLGEKIAELAISNAQSRQRAGKKSRTQENHSRPGATGQVGRLHLARQYPHRIVFSGRGFGRWISKASPR